MACCACGLRQQPQKLQTDYCDQCGCPVGALAPPPALHRRPGRPQRLPVVAPDRLSGERAATLGLLCATLGWLPLYLGVFACALAVLLGGTALRKARRSRRAGLAVWLGWAAVLLGGACAVPALSGL